MDIVSYTFLGLENVQLIVQRICNRIALIDRSEIRLSGELADIERGVSHGEVIIETMALVLPHETPTSLDHGNSSASA